MARACLHTKKVSSFIHVYVAGWGGGGELFVPRATHIDRTEAAVKMAGSLSLLVQTTY